MNIPMTHKMLLATAILFTAHSSMAATGQSQIDVTGNITSQTCSIAASDANKTITLRDSDVALAASNQTPVLISFNIKGCDASFTKATATISGNAVDSNEAGYGPNAVLQNTGTATNVGIGFIGSTSVSQTPKGELSLNARSAEAVLSLDNATSTSVGNITLGAKLVRLNTSEAVEAGTVAGNATVTFTYS